LKHYYDKQKIIRVTLLLGVICLLLLTVSNSIYVNPGNSIVYEIDSPLETYSWGVSYNVSRIIIAPSFIVFNNTGFNITSDNTISVTISHIDEDMFNPADTSDLLLHFEIGNPASATWFNISGFKNASTYKVYANAVLYDTVTANGTGSISWYDIPSWNDVYTVYWSSDLTNSAPVLSNPYPSNNSVNISAAGSSININAVDADSDLMRTDVWTNASGTWTQVAGWDVYSIDIYNWSRRFALDDGYWNFQDAGQYYTNEGNQTDGMRFFVTNIDNDDKNISVTQDWGMTTPLTKYWWSVNCTDNTDWTNETYCFTTKINYPPNITKPYPADGATDVDVTGSPININISDAEGNTMNVSVWSNYTGSWVQYASRELWVVGEEWKGFMNDVAPVGVWNIQDALNYQSTNGWQLNGTRAAYGNITVTDDWGMTTPSTTYYWQVRAYDGNDTSIETYSFTTGVAPDVIVDTLDATYVEENSGTLNGELVSDVNGAGCNVRFEYNTSLDLDYETVNQTKNEGETFSVTIGLQDGTRYYYRAVADNGFGLFYGENVTFVSKPNEHTSMTLTDTSTGFNVSWVDPASGNINHSVLIYNTDHIPTSRTDGMVLYNDTGNYYNHTNLTQGVTYYYSLWAMAYYYPIYQFSDIYLSDSDIYFNASLVQTDPADTSDTTQDPAAEVYLWGTLIEDGGENCNVSFEYGTTDAFGTPTANQVKTTGDTFYFYLSSATRGQIYHYRAKSVNSKGTAYGDNMPFVAQPQIPTILHVNNSWSPSTLNLTWTKGTGANNTYIERNTLSSWSRGSGTTIYNSTGQYYNDTGLQTGVTYYYQAWAYAEWFYNGTNYWVYSTLFDTHYNTTQTVDPPYNGSSSYDTTNLRINLTWTSGNLSDYDVVVQNNNTWATSPSDGWVRQNSSVNDSNYFNGSVDYGAYFTIWSYNETGNIYSTTGLNIPWGAMEINVYDENSPWIPVVNYTLFITNAEGDETYYRESITNPQIISFDDIPFGEDTIIQINHPSYEQRVWHVDLYQNTYYNYTFYLPSIETPPGDDPDNPDNPSGDCTTRSYLDSISVTNPAVDAVISLTYELTDIIEVHIFNDSFFGTYGGWVPVSSDKFSFTSTTVTIDNSVLDINTTIARVHYYYEDCDTYEPPALYYIRVVESYETDYGISDRAVENALVTFQRYINTTDSYEDISILLTDANGYVDLYLMPGVIYKVIISKDGYVTKSSSFQPAPPNEYGQTTEKVFRIDEEAPSSDDPTVDDNVFKNIDWTFEPMSVQQYDAFTVWFNITSSDCKLEWYRMLVWYYNSSNSTWVLLSSQNDTTACGGQLLYNITNVTGKYAIECFYKKINFSEFECFQQGSLIMFISQLKQGLEDFPDMAYFIILIVIMIIVMGFFYWYFATGVVTGYIGIIIFAIGLLMKPLQIMIGVNQYIDGWVIFAITFIMYTVGLYLWSKL